MKYYNTCVYDRNENLLKDTVIEVNNEGKILSIRQDPNAVFGEDDYDCNGCVALPGFMDSCVTLPGSEIFKLFGTDISHYNNFDDYMCALATTPASEPLRGFGYNTFIIGDDGAARIKRILDMRFPNSPSYVFADDMTTVIVNDFILEEAKQYLNITKETHQDGQIDIYEISVLRRNTEIFNFTPDEVRLALMAFQRVMVQNGIVAVRILDTFGDIGTLKVMRALSDQGLWKLMTVVTAPIYPFDSTEEMWDRYREYRELEGGDIYVTGVSMTLDGSIDSGQAALIVPYEIDKGWLGDVVWNTSKLRRCVKDFVKAGIDVNINATGDRAVSLAADVFSVTNKDSTYSDGRKVITHGYLISELDMEICAHSNITVCVEPNSVPYSNSFYQGDQVMIGERVYLEYPVGRLISAGVKIISGSNVPLHQQVSPLKGVYKAAHRTSADDATPYQVTRSYCEAPYSLFGLIGELGTVEVGKRASFVLVDKDIINLREDLLCDANFVATVIDGWVMWINEGIK